MLLLQAGEGGDDAKDFVTDLAQMYLRYAERRDLKVELLKSSPGSMTFQFSGIGANAVFAKEAGKSVVQRESKGRMHTSVVSIAVLPLRRSVYKDLPQSDIEVETKRGSGPGGQAKHATESAVRMTHKPTGISASVNSGRGQHQNRAKVLEVLTARVNQHWESQKQNSHDSVRRSQLGGGSRSDKIRTYNFKTDTVVDHRTGKAAHLKDVMKGKLDLLL